MAVGKGESKREAEQNAEKALDKKKPRGMPFGRTYFFTRELAKKDWVSVATAHSLPNPKIVPRRSRRLRK